jgi:hypothetical protein
MTSNRSILFIAAGIAGLVVAVTAVVLLVGGREPTTFPADSPQGVVQRYLAAWNDEDDEAAYAFFSAQVKAATTLAAYETAARDYHMYNRPGDMPARRVFVDRVTEDGNRATVWLIVEEVSGDGLNATVYRSTRTVAMVRDPDGWRIDEALLWLDPGPFPGPMKQE